jgi:hypothetical protein
VSEDGPAPVHPFTSPASGNARPRRASKHRIGVLDPQTVPELRRPERREPDFRIRVLMRLSERSSVGPNGFVHCDEGETEYDGETAQRALHDATQAEEEEE